ncbi:MULTISPECIES: TIGR03809 family protein [unclassified Bradyrhizobium]|uniref:TIGR03809 family protein n=1 Tax=unclassified Bradyrhizobium TaxID=2631580 RepID=UPI0028EAC588|nr:MULTISPECIES: TIGR03809 family protein [unclassified Bradyrhizobium]
MTHRLNVACSRELSERWCALAQRRLDHLTELFESGRWRRYHTERSLLENIREAKAAVKTWRALALGESVGRETGSAQMDVEAVPAPRPRFRPPVDRHKPVLQPIEVPPTIETVLAESDIVVPEKMVAPEPVPSTPRIDMAALEEALSVGMKADVGPPLLDLDEIERRYPALRHAL